MGGPPSELINLLRGWPAPALLPALAIKSAADSALTNESISTPALQYGPDWGYGPVLENIASWLNAFYTPKSPITPSRLCMTGGASQNLTCILSAYTDPVYTRNIWMVAPTYFMACPIFQDAGFHGRLKSVPEDSEGIDIGYLRKGLQKAEEVAKINSNDRPRLKEPKKGINKFYKHIIYCVPTFANPSAKTMTLNRRRELVHLAREYDALLVSDDVYDFLQWRTTSEKAAEAFPQTAVLPRLVDLDASISGGTDRPGADSFGNAVSNGSFSKIAGPGARCGWAEGTRQLAFGLSQVGATKSGGAPSQLTSTFLAELLKDGFLQKHIRESLQPAYRRRHKLMVDTIKKALGPLGVVILEPAADSSESRSSTIAGGYFLYLRLPSHMSAKDLAVRCKEEENLIIGEGPMFAVYGDEDVVNLNSDIRLCFSWEDEDRIIEGVQRMAKVARRMTKKRAFLLT